MYKSFIAIILVVVALTGFSLFFAEDSVSAAIWKKQLNTEVYSEPLAALDNYVFWGGDRLKKVYKIFAINSKAEIVAQSPVLPSSPFDPIVVGNNVIAADHARVIRGFSLPTLEVAWEVGANSLFEKAPIKCGKNVLQGSGQSIFCLDAATGKQLWDITELEPIKNYGADQVIISIHGYKDVANPSWKCTAYETEEGSEIWQLGEPVSGAAPVFVKDNCILTTKEGEGIIVNQFTGEILYRTGTKGISQVISLDESAIFVSSNSKEIAFFSFATGKPWTTTITKNVTGAIQIGSRVVIADKISIRCFDLYTGNTFWEKKLGDIYYACPHRNGVFVVYKESFVNRETYGACIDAELGTILWIAKGNSIFRKPYPLSEGDLLLSNNGMAQLMPKPTFNSYSNVIMPPVEMPDPEVQIKKAFEKKYKKENNSTAPVKKEESTDW